MASTRNWSSTPARLRPMLNDYDDQRPEDGADDAAATTEQAGAADHHGGDASPGWRRRSALGLARAGAADQDPGGDAVDQSGHGVDAEQHPVDPDADQPGGLDVVADGVDVAAPRGLAEHERDHDQPARRDEDHAGGDPERAERDRGAHQVQDGRHRRSARRSAPPE